MIVLDTNVISELARPEPAPRVIDWLDQQDGDQIFVTSVTVGELLYGLVKMPAGQRRAKLTVTISRLLDDLFENHTLEYSGQAGVMYAKVVDSRRRRGLPIEQADAQIAAICRLHDASLATRNTRDFTETGIRLIDPWAE